MNRDSKLDLLARQILTVDRQGKSFIPKYLSILENGLAPAVPVRAKTIMSGVNVHSSPVKMG